MRISVRGKPGVGGAVVASTSAVLTALLIGGCSSTIDGRPIASPGAGATEPAFPTPRSTRPAPPPSAPAIPGGAIPLPADDNGYVFIETKSGKTRCQISAESVGCEAEFANSPMRDGQHANGVSVTADGTIEWVLGNLGAIPAVTLDYRTYDAQGWTIAASIDGTRFTNNGTGHGMFVSIENVEAF